MQTHLTTVDNTSFESSSSPSVPVTPPSTPTHLPDTVQDSLSLAPFTMFDLTRAKLERAAQSTGGRGARGLRELVLLSNVFSRPQWLLEREHEAQQREIDQRRREDEQLWLDSVLEEMMLEDGAEGDEDYVNLTLRGDRPVGDSGFLEATDEQKRYDSSLDPLQDSLDSIEEVPDDEVDDTIDPVGSDSLPFPSRSPPIDLPPIRINKSVDDSQDCRCSLSPPIHPPALTPDSTPPGPGPAGDLMGSSFDSLSSDCDDGDPFAWIRTQRGLEALDLSEPSQMYRGGEGDHYFRPDDDAVGRKLDVGPLNVVNATPSTSLALTVRRTAIPDDRIWYPAPRKSLSLPRTTHYDFVE